MNLRVVSSAEVGCTAAIVDGMRMPHLGGPGIDIPRCKKLLETWQKAVEKHVPDLVLVITGFAGPGERRVDGAWTHPCREDYDDAYRKGLTEGVRILAGRGAAVALVTMLPTNVRRQLTRIGVTGVGETQFDRLQGLADEHMECKNRSRHEIASASEATILDLQGFLCSRGECVLRHDGKLLRSDGLHFRDDGAVTIAHWLLARSRALLPTVPP